MDDQRIEYILITLARQYAPVLFQTWDQRGDYQQRLPRLARGLANHGILVIMGDPPYSLRGLGDDVRGQIQAWVNNYALFYQLLAQTLFPSYTGVGAHYTDDKWPVVIFIRGDAAAVIQRMAGYVAPFVCFRQMDARVSEVELSGVMDLILEELEASTLSPEDYKRLRAEGTNLLKRMLENPIRQLQLTDFDQPLFSESKRFVAIPKTPRKLPEEDSQVTRPEQQFYTRPDTTKSTQTQTFPTVIPPTWTVQPPAPPPVTNQPPPAPPASVPAPPPAPPEVTPPETPVEPDENLFGSSIPIFFTRNKDASKKIRRPPLPPLPEDKNS